MTDQQPLRPAAMHRDQVRQVIDAQRRSLADLLDDVSDEQWRGRRCARLDRAGR